ncbi:hypothetical protein [Mycolicibacterium komossense]|uniref:Methyl-accepting chemotaxis sensory transducer n=1 Tax=Mycolicibacterium komossense TaxID=1779 RepID=A0ABT3C5R0_9MYCO|nr:hypothetical protein [Mycolicibacterium komossense]MCV7224794.1 hypothetical protein [Mycolicibacterium komossense]
MPTVASGGDSAFAAAIKAGRWPSPEVFEQVAAAHDQQASALVTAVDTSCAVHRPRLAQALQGQAGDAQIAAHNANIDLWDTHADVYTQSASAVRSAAGELRGLQHDLRLLIEDKEPQYNSALKRKEPLAAQGVLTDALNEADGMVATRGDAAAKYVQGVNFTAPLPQAPASPDGQNNTDRNGPPERDKRTDASHDGDKKGTATGDGANSTAADPQRDVKTDMPPKTDTPNPEADGPPRDARTDLPPPDALPNSQQPLPVTGRMPAMPSQLGAGGQGSGGSGGGSGMSGLGSAFKPPSSLGSSSSMPTSPASSMPSVPSAPSSSSAASPMSNPGSSFQSGLASGMSAAGGGGNSFAPSPVSQQMPQQALVAHQAATGAPAFGSGPAGVPLSAPGGDAGVGGGTGGSSSGGGASAGGGTPMMPPAAMGGGAPLAPYSAPGAGAAGAAGGGAGTTPATSGQSSPSAGSGGVGAPGPLVAGGAGSTVSAPGVAALTSEVNPDMLLAQRVLGGLARGCEDWPAPIAWAVSVLKTPVGSQVMVASSLGGGSYMPATVFLPATARLAVVDPALPYGWAWRWMGSQKPSKLLVDHFEQLGRKVAGVSISAMVTTELWPDTPAGVTDFAGFEHRQALRLASVAPSLDGAHQHRLTALDPVLAQRISSINSNGRVHAGTAAAEFTAAVIRAATQPDPTTGRPLSFEDEAMILQAVSAGLADTAAWQRYRFQVAGRDGKAWLFPDSHAAPDPDGSELSESVNVWYRYYFRGGRIVELVELWKDGGVPPLAEIAYCGVQAGFGPVVSALIGAIEQRIRSDVGQRP